MLFALTLVLVPAAMALDPDLRIRDARVYPAALSPGESYKIGLVLENYSGVRFQQPWSFSIALLPGGSYVSITPSFDDGLGPYTCSVSGDVVICKSSKPPLGGVSTGFDVNFTAGSAPGGGIRLVADPANTITESNEGNNIVTVNYFTRPDLAVTALTYGPTPPRRGQEIKVEAAYKNVGTVAIRYERLTLRINGPSPFKISRTEPATTFPAGAQTSAEIEFYPGYLDVGATGAFRVYLQTETVQKLNFFGWIKSFDSQGRDYEKNLNDNTKSVYVDVVQ